MTWCVKFKTSQLWRRRSRTPTRRYQPCCLQEPVFCKQPVCCFLCQFCVCGEELLSKSSLDCIHGVYFKGLLKGPVETSTGPLRSGWDIYQSQPDLKFWSDPDRSSDLTKVNETVSARCRLNRVTGHRGEAQWVELVFTTRPPPNCDFCRFRPRRDSKPGIVLEEPQKCPVLRSNV